MAATSSGVAVAAVARYTKEAKVGQGTYAVVFRGRDTVTGETVAVKKIRLGRRSDGIHMAAIREIHLLRELGHPNVVKVLDVFQHKSNLHLVLEYLDSDLEQVIQDKRIPFLSPANVKSWMLMALRGLHHCHTNWVLHRDIKPNNMLLSATGQLKLADFGLAKRYADPTVPMTPTVVTLFYRAPELLYGARAYSVGVDMWAMGCVLAELMLRTPYLPGDSDLKQLETIFRALGTPTDADWPDMAKLPSFVRFQPMEKPRMRDTFTGAGDDVLDLLQELLAFDPSRRPSASQALRHPYFQNEPRPTPPQQLPRPQAAAAGRDDAPTRAVKRTREQAAHAAPGAADALPESPPADAPAPRRRLQFS